jgi:hypothetical protein
LARRSRDCDRITAVGLTTDLYLGRFKTGDENVLTRKRFTQVRRLRRAGDVMIVLVSVGAAMMTLPTVRQYGVSLFASAGAAGIVVGLAARPRRLAAGGPGAYAPARERTGRRCGEARSGLGRCC